MTDNELFAKHAQSYLLCYNDKCPTRKQCLRWIIKDHTPEDMPVVSILNPRYAKTTDNECPYFKSNKKQKMAVGMTLFFDEMPRKTEQSVRNALPGAPPLLPLPPWRHPYPTRHTRTYPCSLRSMRMGQKARIRRIYGRVRMVTTM